MLAALDRHLKEHDYKYSTARDRELYQSKLVLEGKVKHLRQRGFRQNTDPRSTDPLLTPLLTPYKINGKMRIKKPRTISGTRYKFINKFSLPETSEMAVA